MPKVSILMPARIRNADESLWMTEAIDSVRKQTVFDWELVIVDDHSDIPLLMPEDVPEDMRIILVRANENVGTSMARNMAADLATSDLLLPLDADDRLTPDALEKFLAAWKGDGFIYSSVMMFGLDWMRQWTAPPYSFYDLLKNVPCVVSGLHKKSDWAKVGGWKPAMDGGLEDWEYWIALGELGVCGVPIPDVCYWYRRKANGRLGHLLNDRKNYQAAYSKMRDLHKDVYDGRYPMGCCGGRRVAPRAAGQQAQSRSMANYTPPANVVLVQYTGRRGGSFGVRGNRSGIRYTVPGIHQLVQQPDGSPGIDVLDLPFFRSLGRGADFDVYVPPKV